MVADLGNSRLKWGRVETEGRVVETGSLPAEDEMTWAKAWDEGSLGKAGGLAWMISSVNPVVAERLAKFLKSRGVTRAAWYRSAAEVGVRHALERPETAGADRALAVVAAVARMPAGKPGLVVLCGTAVTVERIAADGLWQGGAIAAGLTLTAKALNLLTAQLPLVVPRAAPRSWGNATGRALEAGIYWGVVGAVRELLARQSEGMAEKPWVVWSGGDAVTLAPAVGLEGSVIVPDLVLHGLAAISSDAMALP